MLVSPEVARYYEAQPVRGVTVIDVDVRGTVYQVDLDFAPCALQRRCWRRLSSFEIMPAGGDLVVCAVCRAGPLIQQFAEILAQLGTHWRAVRPDPDIPGDTPFVGTARAAVLAQEAAAVAVDSAATPAAAAARRAAVPAQEAPAALSTPLAADPLPPVPASTESAAPGAALPPDRVREQGPPPWRYADDTPLGVSADRFLAWLQRRLLDWQQEQPALFRADSLPGEVHLTVAPTLQALVTGGQVPARTHRLCWGLPLTRWITTPGPDRCSVAGSPLGHALTTTITPVIGDRIELTLECTGTEFLPLFQKVRAAIVRARATNPWPDAALPVPPIAPAAPVPASAESAAAPRVPGRRRGRGRPRGKGGGTTLPLNSCGLRIGRPRKNRAAHQHKRTSLYCCMQAGACRLRRSSGVCKTSVGRGPTVSSDP